MNNRDANSTNRRITLLGTGDAPMTLRMAAARMTRAACHVPEEARQATHEAAAELEDLARVVEELVEAAAEYRRRAPNTDWIATEAAAERLDAALAGVRGEG